MITAVLSPSDLSATATASTILSRFSARDLPTLFESHRSWWHDYYPKSFLSIPDTRLEGYYWIQIYKLACATRSDRPAMDVIGPWTYFQAWPAIWWNMNIQMAYWPTYASNHLEIGQSLCQLLDHGLASGALIRNVPEVLRDDCAAIGRVTSYDCALSEPIKTTGKELCNLAWACHNYYLHYRYSMDDAMLRDRLFPLLRRAINFYLRLLTVGSDGKLHLPTAISPEYPDKGPDTQIDLALCRWGCQILMSICDRLKLDDPLIPRWQQVLRDLASAPVDENGLMVAAGVPLSRPTRHVSQFLPIYPLHLLNRDLPADRGLITRTINHWLSHPSEFVGFSYPMAAIFLAQDDRPDEALAWLDTYLDSETTSNAIFLEPAPKWSGLIDGHVVETALLVASSLHEMLLQSWGGILRIFPAIPSSWDQAIFHHLRAEGAFLVSASRQNGRTAWIAIESLAGEPCRIKTDMRPPFRIHADCPISIETVADDTIVIPLQKGEKITLIAAGAPHSSCEILPLSPQPNGLNYYGAFKPHCITSRYDRRLVALAGHAQCKGPNLRFVLHGGANHLAGFRSDADIAQWQLAIPTPGTYYATLVYTCAPEQAGQVFRFSLDRQIIEFTTRPTFGTRWFPYQKFDLGTIHIPTAGIAGLSLYSATSDNRDLFHLHRIELKLVK